MKGQSFTLTKAVRNEQLVRELDRKRHKELFRVAFLGVILTVAGMAGRGSGRIGAPFSEILRLSGRPMRSTACVDTLSETRSPGFRSR